MEIVRFSGILDSNGALGKEKKQYGCFVEGLIRILDGECVLILWTWELWVGVMVEKGERGIDIRAEGENVTFSRQNKGLRFAF